MRNANFLIIFIKSFIEIGNTVEYLKSCKFLIKLPMPQNGLNNKIQLDFVI